MGVDFFSVELSSLFCQNLLLLGLSRVILLPNLVCLISSPYLPLDVVVFLIFE